MAKLSPGAVEAIVVCFVLAFLGVLILCAYVLARRARRNVRQSKGSNEESLDIVEVIEEVSPRPGRHNRYPGGRANYFGPGRPGRLNREYSPERVGGEVSCLANLRRASRILTTEQDDIEL
jgi:hypothetical protein